MTTPTFNNSYFITNRNDPETIWVDSTTVVVPGPLSYYLSNTPYDQSTDDYNAISWSSFLSDLNTDLASTVDENGNANLAVYIHGLANTFDDAIEETAAFGSALASPGGFNELVIERGHIELALTKVEHYARVTVCDSGRGIDADLLPYIFETFRQGENDRNGMGLGLSIVRHIVELHGGHVYAESAGKDQGSTFTLNLPLAQEVTKNSVLYRSKDSALREGEVFRARA